MATRRLTLISSIGRETAPALWLHTHFLPDRHILMGTNDTVQRAVFLKEALKFSGSEVTIVKVSPYAFNEIRKSLEGYIDEHTIVDLTSGTKPMVLALWTEMMEKGAKGLYFVPSMPPEIVWLWPEDKREPARDNFGIDLEIYLKAYGIENRNPLKKKRGRRGRGRRFESDVREIFQKAGLNPENMMVKFPNGEEAEIDGLFLLNMIPVIYECKTSGDKRVPSEFTKMLEHLDEVASRTVGKRSIRIMVVNFNVPRERRESSRARGIHIVRYEELPQFIELLKEGKVTTRIE